MPIIGLTDQAARFPQIGQIRKGAPKPEKGNRPGADLKYFRFESNDESVSRAFAAAYGDEPAAINVFLPFPTPEQNFTAWQEEYVASGLVHRCDGETMTQWLTPQNTYSFEPKPCPYHTGEKKRTSSQPGCKPTGRLMVIIPELERLAYVMVGTTSIHDIMELTSNLNAAYAFRGDLTGIPFVLRRMPRMISTPSGSNGGKARREKWLLFLEPAPQWVSLQIEAMRYKALPGTHKPNLALPQPERITVDSITGEILDDDEDENEVVDAEPVVVKSGNGDILPDHLKKKDTQADEPRMSNTPLRPYDPESLKAALNKQAAYYEKNGTAESFTDKQKGGMTGTLEKMCGGEQQRHDFLLYVFNATSMNDLGDTELTALKKWIAIKKVDDQWLPSTYAVKEAAAVVSLTEKHPDEPEDYDELLQLAKENPDSIHAVKVLAGE
jgi:hypothetical protein